MSTVAPGPSPQAPRYSMGNWQRPVTNVARRAASGLSPGWALAGLGLITLGVNVLSRGLIWSMARQVPSKSPA